MNRLELIEILSSASEEDVYIKAEDGLLDDFDIEQVDEQFDGFYTATPSLHRSCVKARQRNMNNTDKSCHDCLWRDFPKSTGFCPYPDFRRPEGGYVCPHWEWRYQ